MRSRAESYSYLLREPFGISTTTSTSTPRPPARRMPRGHRRGRQCWSGRPASSRGARPVSGTAAHAVDEGVQVDADRLEGGGSDCEVDRIGQGEQTSLL